jgi:hypothetical protein
VFARPPRLVQWIEQPELYVRAAGGPDLAAVLRRVEQALAPEDWAVTQQSFTPVMVLQVATLLRAREQAEKAVKTWQEGRSVVWSRKSHPGQQVALSLARFDHAAGARLYFACAADLQRKHDEASNNPSCGMPLKVVESRAVAVSIQGLEEAVRTDRRVQIPGATTTLPTSTFLGRAGTQVIEITWHGTAPDSPWAERLVSRLLH